MMMITIIMVLLGKIVVWLYDQLIRPGYIYMVEVLKNELKVQNENKIRIFTIVLAIYIGFCTLYLALIWIPFIYKIKDEIRQIRGFLGMIPVPVIMNTRKLKDFFGKVLFKHN